MPSKPTVSKFTANRRSFLQTTLTGGVAAALTPLYPALGAARASSSGAPASAGATPTARAPEIASFELDEVTISQLQEGMQSGKFTARSLVEKYTARIAEIDKAGPAINSIIEL